MPGNDIIFCDERAKERDRDRPGGHADAAAAVAAARPGRTARRRRTRAVGLADRADAAVRQGRCRCACGEPHGPYAFFAPKTAARLVRQQEEGAMADPATADLYEVMEVAWPSGDALRGESPNHPPVPWLKTVVLNGAGKVGT